MTDEDFTQAVRYRLAYGIAARRLEADQYGAAWGKGRGRVVADLLAEVAREIGSDPRDEAAREGVDDAAEGRRPRW